jgi:F-type H+-transporting ATPase subunit epsilon
MKLSLFAPNRKLLDNVDVSSVLVTGSEGQIEILPGHANMVGLLQPGLFGYKTSEGAVWAFISVGFFEVLDSHVFVMGETIELSHEIDLGRAKAAQKKAEEALKDQTAGPENFNKYQLKLQRSLLRQSVFGKTD